MCSCSACCHRYYHKAWDHDPLSTEWSRSACRSEALCSQSSLGIERARVLASMFNWVVTSGGGREGSSAEAGTALASEGGQDVRGDVLEAIERIRNCSSQEATEEAALAFCYVNSKGARKRLVSTGGAPLSPIHTDHHPSACMTAIKTVYIFQIIKEDPVSSGEDYQAIQLTDGARI